MTFTMQETKQMHFNWGYQDALGDIKYNRPNKWIEVSHFDLDYKAGYLYGFEAAKKEKTENEKNNT